jgi:hypothetical protein
VNTRTVARIEYTEKLLTLRQSRLDSVDLETFLQGFDAGEQWASYTQDWDTFPDKQGDRQATAAWLTSTDGVAIRESVHREVLRYHTHQVNDEAPAMGNAAQSGVGADRRAASRLESV